MLVVVKPSAAHANVESNNKESVLVVAPPTEEEAKDILWRNLSEDIWIRQKRKIEIIKRVANDRHWIDDANNRIALLVVDDNEVMGAKIAMHEELRWVVLAGNIKGAHDLRGRDGADVAAGIFDFVKEEGAPSGVLFVKETVAVVRIFREAADDGLDLPNCVLDADKFRVELLTIDELKALIAELLIATEEFSVDRVSINAEKFRLSADGIGVGYLDEVLVGKTKNSRIGGTIGIKNWHDTSEVHP